MMLAANLVNVLTTTHGRMPPLKARSVPEPRARVLQRDGSMPLAVLVGDPSLAFRSRHAVRKMPQKLREHSIDANLAANIPIDRIIARFPCWHGA
jgi:hypothetical protein